MTSSQALPPPTGRRAAAAACGADIQLHLLAGHGLVPVPAQLTYTQADPYAVRLHCLTSPTSTVTWVLARETLRSGLRQASGLGDVLIRPGPGGGSVYITLGNGAEAAVLRADAAEIRRFLRLTERVVPRGAEGHHLDLDALVDQLRASG